MNSTITGKEFAKEMYRAIEGRICTPERMAKLYPIFREINLETDKINAEWNAFEKRSDAAKKGWQTRRAIREN